MTNQPKKECACVSCTSGERCTKEVRIDNNSHPTQDEGEKWEKEFRNKFCYDYGPLKTEENFYPFRIIDFIRSLLQKSREELGNKVLDILTDEISITHTQKRGKTSGLTSTYMRIKGLLKNE